MTATQPAAAATTAVYDLEGSLLEACSCAVLCPCWIGEDPDGGSCSTGWRWSFEYRNAIQADYRIRYEEPAA